MPSTVSVSLTGVEPLKSFIEGCARALSCFDSLDAGERESLPPRCATGIETLRGELRNLRESTGIFREIPD